MADDLPADVPQQVRSACAWVASRARFVSVDEPSITPYAEALLARPRGHGDDSPVPFGYGDPESSAAFILCLDAINFGSGWWPTIRKRPGCSGYGTIAAALTDRFRTEGAWTAEELARLSIPELAAALGQPPEHPLIAQFVASLHDLGTHVLAEHDGRFEHVIEAAGGSAVSLANLLARWSAFADVSSYEGERVPFYKRAQIAAADLDRAGVADFRDLNRLTAFADNLIPHVLRLDGVIRLDPTLTRAIDAGELLVHESPQEVELRACAIHAVELLSAATGGELCPAAIDAVLWNRGGEQRYKEVRRPRSRNTAY